MKLRMFTILIANLLLCELNIAYAQKTGTIALNQYVTSGYLATMLQAKYSLEDGSEFIKITPLKDSNAAKYDLKLKPGQTALLRFSTSFKDGSYPGYCKILFDHIDKSSAHFVIAQDTTLYGCDIDNNGYIRINF